MSLFEQHVIWRGLSAVLRTIHIAVDWLGPVTGENIDIGLPEKGKTIAPQLVSAAQSW
jgi:hypothetical protein